MSKQKIFINIFSNWATLILTVAAAFFVSPIMVHSLGNENYGIWVLIGSVAGYFTLLDLGVSTALIRYISKYEAQGKHELSRKIYSNSFYFFSSVSLFIFLFTVIFAFFFKDLFNIKGISDDYLYWVFVIVGSNSAVSIFFTPFVGSLVAVQEFLKLNIISICSLILKNVILVVMLLIGYSLLTIAIIHISTTTFSIILRYLKLRLRHKNLRYLKSDFDKTILKKIFTYSVYSFIIAIAFRILFFTDSIVIGSLISVIDVTYYSIPIMLMIYLEQLVYAAMSVMTPVISENDALDNKADNQIIYLLGTRYSHMLSLPILFVLFTNGDSFISMWMGQEYADHGAKVLKILSIGYTFYLSQVIANSILKGMSRHKVFSYILISQALVNLTMSLALARVYGIEGVALGTTIPLIVANIFIVPFYTCKVLELRYVSYIFKSYFPLFIFTMVLSFTFFVVPIKVSTYSQLTGYSAIVASLYIAFSLFFVLEKNHKVLVFNRIRKIVTYRLSFGFGSGR